MHSALIPFIRAVIVGDIGDVSRRLAENPTLATTASPMGAARHGASDFFFTDISHYMYAGDTALHMAAAAGQLRIAKMLIAHGADVRARNRRGAEPLHYAADANALSPKAQATMVAYLVSVGADPNALDKSGVAPIHRAVRTRSLGAVRALRDAGADIHLRNKSGSTPMKLARLTTGKSGSGTAHARAQQANIIALLQERGARAR